MASLDTQPTFPELPRVELPLRQETVDHVVCTVASGDMVDVRHYEVVEQMSSLFEIKLVAMSTNPDIDFEAVIGQPMTFGISAGATRTWTGICSHLQQVRVEQEHLSTYELTLVPRLWLATERRNFRMFQHLTELEIVQKLLAEWEIDPQLRLGQVYKKRKYRVQYGETDYAFMCRMLEDAGISFYFDQGKESRLVLDDGPQSNNARAPISYIDRPNDALLEHVTQVTVGRTVRPGRYTVRDHDYRRPASYKLVGTAAEQHGVEDRLERYHYVPGAFLYEGDGGEPTPYADDKGAYRPDLGEGQSLAQRRLEAQRASARQTSFKTNTLDLAPGSVLSFLDHPKSELAPDKRLLVIESRYTGDVPGKFDHRCTSVSAEPRFTPALKTTKPRVTGVESATVVGPAGQEIHTDEFGRVRLHFHWDRESKMNEDSSCWIHVSQPWGGTGFGGTNLPRIGQEVIVDFLSGDPDRPIIVGRVYTNLQKTPYSLPENKTQSGWKSNSSPETGGFNELRFEDKAGEELLRMQAEKDLSKLVKNNEDTKIGNDRTSQIGNNESQLVGNDFMKQVMSNAMEQVGLQKFTQAGEKITLVCGKSSFTMDKEGNIELKGVNITIDGKKHVQVVGDPIDLNFE